MPRTCIDRGGTFTDVVVLEGDGRALARKVRNDRVELAKLLRGETTFGTTVATNALLERAVAPALLVVDEGLADLVHIGDMTRPDLFDPDALWPSPLCAAVVEVAGRDGQGSLPSTWPLDGIEAVAIALIHSPRDPGRERAVADAILLERPDLYVALGSEICPELGLLSRIETTLVDAAVTPVLRRALAKDGVPENALAVRSDGSLCPVRSLRAPDAVLSGPAAGVVAVAHVARVAGVARAIGLDMGGTSTDVCAVGEGGVALRFGEVRVAGARLRRPALEIETIASGGGSILWADAQRIGVGPRSAGAVPGPQCYGQGGPPALTDAAVVDGRVDPEAFAPPLAVERIALPGPAAPFLDLAAEQMAAAVRRLCAGRGLDPADHALVAFGGAAGQHAAEVAERLGIGLVLVHPLAGVLSAFGQAIARREEQGVRAIGLPLADGWAAVEAAWRELIASLPALGETIRTVEVRHRGTDGAIEVDAIDAASARRAFVEAHRARYGFDRDLSLEIATARVRTRAPRPGVADVPLGRWTIAGREWTTETCAGPLRLDAGTTSVVVPRGWEVSAAEGLLRLERRAAPPAPPPAARTPHAVAVWASRFQAVASDAGAVLERLARSINIRERRDFSCAVFDGNGWLVANAPHVPVHLGAMGATVRDLLRVEPDPVAGQAWLCNDPAAGGSHLPDLTVVTPVVLDGLRFFVACRGHHADVGGITPGSMPPRSTTLAEEGLVFRHLPLLDAGAMRADLDPWLRGCRQPEIVRADLEAQVAANASAARALRALGPGRLVSAWTGHLLDVAEESVAAVLDRLPARCAAADDVDGVPLHIALSRDADRIVVDFAGTGGPHVGNLNAPAAVVCAAVLYALRVLAGRPIPLNEGALRRVDLRIPNPSILSPPPDAAVAGGNVETSQRLVDLLLYAAGHMAFSGGSMTNLSLGGDGWTHYETLGAGQGASPRGPGAHARQLHMTNTRATDPEILEHRIPARVRVFQVRRGSGGEGVHRGGDGLVRELEVLAPTTATLLAAWRPGGAPGLGAGGPGAPGQAFLIRRGATSPWDGDEVSLNAGDRIRLETPGGGGWAPER